MEFFLAKGGSCSYDDESIYIIEVPLRSNHLVKRWVPKDLPKINTDFCANERIYRIVPSSLHGLGLFSTFWGLCVWRVCLMCVFSVCFLSVFGVRIVRVLFIWFGVRVLCACALCMFRVSVVGAFCGCILSVCVWRVCLMCVFSVCLYFARALCRVYFECL